MVITIVVFLYLYLLFVGIWLIFSLIAYYHLIRYGQINFFSFLAGLAYLAVAVIILSQSYQYLNQIDWTRELVTIQGVSLFSNRSF